MEGSELMDLPANWLHLRAIYLVAMFNKGGTGYIDEAIADLDREALNIARLATASNLCH
jgi:hypothetical protein